MQIFTWTNTNTKKLSEYNLIRKYNTKKIQMSYKCNVDNTDDGDDENHSDNKCSIEICSTVRKAS